MILEILKKHSGKIGFFVINVLIIFISVLYLKDRDLKKALDASIVKNDNLSLSNQQNGVVKTYSTPASNTTSAVKIPAAKTTKTS